LTHYAINYLIELTKYSKLYQKKFAKYFQKN